MTPHLFGSAGEAHQSPLSRVPGRVAASPGPFLTRPLARWDTVFLHFRGRRQAPSRSMELGVAELAMALLGVTLLALLALWMYRMVQYRKAVRRSQARWLDYEPAPVLTESELGLNWPSLKPILLSPIPEERLESGRVRLLQLLCSCGESRAGCCGWLIVSVCVCVY